MDHMTRQFEALKLLKDWSVWMVTVQVAAIAFLGSTDRLTIEPGGFAFPFTIACFSVSIAMAAWVLSGIPNILTRIAADNTDKTFLHYKLYNIEWLPDFVTLNKAALAQHYFFLLGLAGLAILVIFCRA